MYARNYKPIPFNKLPSTTASLTNEYATGIVSNTIYDVTTFAFGIANTGATLIRDPRVTNMGTIHPMGRIKG